MNLSYYEQQTIKQLKKYSSKFRPISGKQIADNIGLRPREKGLEGADMRAIIHQLRLKGYPICANRHGYYLTEDRKELMRFMARLQKRIESQRQAVEGLRSALQGLSAEKSEEEQLKEFSQKVLV